MRGIGHWLQQAARQPGTGLGLVNRHGTICGRQNSARTLCALTPTGHLGKHCVVRRLKLVVGGLYLSSTNCAMLPLLELRERSTSMETLAGICLPGPTSYILKSKKEVRHDFYRQDSERSLLLKGSQQACTVQM